MMIFHDCARQQSALDVLPSLGRKPVALKVNLGLQEAQGGTLAEALRTLYRKSEFCDVTLACGEQQFPCHRAVLVARSRIFKEGLAQCSAPRAGGERQEVRLLEVSNPEAVRFMLDYIYETDETVWPDYIPATQEINKDVLRLAQRFQLPGLTHRAKLWLKEDITTGNVLERLAICGEFGLDDLRQGILRQLTMSHAALREVANSPQIVGHPELMQALLQQTASQPPAAARESPSPKKRARRGTK